MNSGFWEDEVDLDVVHQRFEALRVFFLNQLTAGLLNLSTILALFLMDIVPSRRTYRYL